MSLEAEHTGTDCTSCDRDGTHIHGGGLREAGAFPAQSRGEDQGIGNGAARLTFFPIKTMLPLLFLAKDSPSPYLNNQRTWFSQLPAVTVGEGYYWLG